MNNIKLDERMTMLSSMVRQGSRALDIGTDHAYLPAYLVLNGKCPSACAADIGEGPLANAGETVRRYGLEDKIKLYLSDGFDNVPERCGDDVIIAGMGGTLIVQLLSRCGWIRSNTVRLVLQPMTHAEDVRVFLSENGFRITEEAACFHEKRVYVCICAEYDGIEREKDFSYRFTGELGSCKSGVPAVLAHIKKQQRWVGERIDALTAIGSDSRELDDLISARKAMQELCSFISEKEE